MFTTFEREMRNSGDLDFSETVHVWFMRLCFIPVIHNDKKKKRWTHWIIIEHYTLCPAGRQSFLCRNSEIFGCYYIKKGCRHKHSLFVWTYPGYAFTPEELATLTTAVFVLNFPRKKKAEGNAQLNYSLADRKNVV